jgi:hypothetical protein
MRTPSQMEEDDSIKHEQNQLSRESKGLTKEFSEYDRQNQKAIDFYDINLNVNVNFVLRRQVAIDKSKLILDSVKKNLNLNDSLSCIEKNGRLEYIVFHSDSILDLSSDLIERIENELDRVIDIFK